jgi:hypothetical protein
MKDTVQKSRPMAKRRIDSYRALKPNGVFLVEAYTPDQLKPGRGGGNSVDTITSKESLRLELDGLTFKHLIELERDVLEGIYHTGRGAVVQAIATKES